MSKKILITGGAGFIGSRLVKKLHELNYRITILDNLSPQIHGIVPDIASLFGDQAGRSMRFIKGDVTSRDDWEAALEGQQIVVHLAAETGTGQSMYQIEHYTHVNIGGTALLLDILANSKHSVEKVVVASSRAIYGEGKYASKEFGIVYPGHRKAEDMKRGFFEVTYPGCNEPLEVMSTDELSRIHPSSVYGISKQVQEQLVMTVTQSIGIAGVAFRYQNVYGPGQSLSNPYTGILSIFSTRIKNGNSINIFEDGKESRDFVYVDDVVDATLLGIEKEEANGQVFNVGSGIPVSVRTVVNELMKQFGKEVPVEITGNFRLGDIRHNYADLAKISRTLGFKPEVPFSEGIARFANWVNSQNAMPDQYDKSLEELKAKGLMK